MNLRQLRRLIREELRRSLHELSGSGAAGSTQGKTPAIRPGPFLGGSGQLGTGGDDDDTTITKPGDGDDEE